jgi:hypothetical protein
VKRFLVTFLMLVSSFAVSAVPDEKIWLEAVFAQANKANITMYDLQEVALLNQGTFVIDSSRATIRIQGRIAYVFANSFDVIVDGQDIRLNAPVLLQEKKWLAPRVLLEALQLKVPPPVREPTNLQTLELPWEDLLLKPGVRGLHLFYTSEFGTIDDASIFLMPFEQVAKLENDLQSNVQKVLATLNLEQKGKILYFSVQLEPNSNPINQLEFIQGSTRYSVENSAGLYSFSGTFPKTSLGAVKLPNNFNLREPIRVTWGDSSADYVFIR